MMTFWLLLLVVGLVGMMAPFFLPSIGAMTDAWTEGDNDGS